MLEILFGRIEAIRCDNKGYWADRITYQLMYLLKMQNNFGQIALAELEKAVADLEISVQNFGAVTAVTVRDIEHRYGHFSRAAKKLEALCIGHAHIDMNWQWGWHETVQLTIDTVRTVLDLMAKYPSFKFSQSQAAVYQIIAEYDETMLAEVKQRIKEGRWEVAAATWVEGDKNMTNGESELRQYLYTRQYLSELLEIDANSLTFEFEPDTFGHNANVPEIAAQCGVKYYYFCRGYDNPKIGLFRWQAPSGNELIAFAEPTWYMHRMSGKVFQHLPEFCFNNSIEKTLVIYGVGDHGGGPTRKDIEMIIDMQSWPFAPQINFAVYQDFFRHAEIKRELLPIIKQELNFVFDGCYTTATRIKMANRFAEYALYDAELYSVLAVNMGRKYRAKQLESGWRNTIFNHFHDILPGSGVVETREYALGLFQETMATANTEKISALRAIAAQIDTADLFPKDDQGDGLADGAGVAYGAKRFKMSMCQRADGKARVYHLFNQLPFERSETVEIPIWEWAHDKSRIIVENSAGETITHQVMDEKDIHSWGCNMFRILVSVTIPAGGYETIVLTENCSKPVNMSQDLNPRTIQPKPYVLENDFLRAQFTKRGELISLFDKVAQLELVNAGAGGGQFRLGIEADQGMSAWVVWPFKSEQSLHECVEIKQHSCGAVRQFITFKSVFNNSSILWTVSLDKTSERLEYDMDVDWREFGVREQAIPNLHFRLVLAQPAEKFTNDIACGVICREARDHDVPGLSFIAGGGLQLITDCKYGYRGYNNALQVTLIRSSNDPDEHPEAGRHYIRMALAPQADAAQLQKTSVCFNKPPEVLSAYKPTVRGSLPKRDSLFAITGQNVILSAMKKAEATGEIIVRLYSLTDQAETTTLTLAKAIIAAREVDGNEQTANFGALLQIFDGTLKITLQPFAVHTLALQI